MCIYISSSFQQREPIRFVWLGSQLVPSQFPLDCFKSVMSTSRWNNVNQHYLPYSYICTCAGTKQLDIHKTCAVTLTGKHPPNCDPELQQTELVQDTKALMVQDTKALMVQDTKISRLASHLKKKLTHPNTSTPPHLTPLPLICMSQQMCSPPSSPTAPDLYVPTNVLSPLLPLPHCPWSVCPNKCALPPPPPPPLPLICMSQQMCSPPSSPSPTAPDLYVPTNVLPPPPQHTHTMLESSIY